MRRALTQAEWQDISARIQSPGLPLDLRAALRLKLFLEHEEIVREGGERIPAYRTLTDFPDIYADGEKERLQAGFHVHEQGRVCNISSDWEGVLKSGLEARRTGDSARDMCLDAVLSYADRYDDPDLSHALHKGARTYREALASFRILHFCLWASNVYHNTVGRFDQYMLPYYENDLREGRLDRAEALALTEEFFFSFNRDSDLYTGMQRGDNGQSLMLGAPVNDLTEICLEASLHNRRIDPKINLRVDQNTPLSVYLKCTELTRQGLGFPQYANDDAVIPALEGFGYTPKDARDYTVAACWEFIIPGVGMDIPNIGAVSLAQAARDVIVNRLPECETYDALFEYVKKELFDRADALEKSLKPLWIEPAPYQSLLMSDYTHDVSEGAKYNNFGIHGTGFSSAVDQLAAVKALVYECKTLSKEALLSALQNDFENAADIRFSLLHDAPKLGRDDECLPVLNDLLTAFADSWQGRVNERGGVFRPGTGSAMYYLWHGRELPATADGRRKGESLPANFTPSLNLRDAGPLSVIRAMASPSHLSRAMNGGPLTLEMHDTVLQNDEGMEKVALLARAFIQMGGHQLQLNAVSRVALLDARERPEEHQNLIVRVWGWSGRFTQLDREYQDQIINRVCY